MIVLHIIIVKANHQISIHNKMNLTYFLYFSKNIIVNYGFQSRIMEKKLIMERAFITTRHGNATISGLPKIFIISIG